MGLFDGLFPSSTRTDVSTSVQRVIEDRLLPDSIKKGTITSILQDGSVPEYVLEECVQSIGTAAERMYSFGQDRYLYGNPTSELFLTTQKDQALLEVLQREQASPTVQIEYSHFGLPNLYHVGWMKLLEEQDYDPDTNQIGKLSTATKKVFLKDMVLLAPSVAEAAKFSPASLTCYGPAPSAGSYPGKPDSVSVLGGLVSAPGTTIDASVASMELLVSYVWEEDETYTMQGSTQTYTRKVVKEASMKLSTTGYRDVSYFQVRYKAGAKTYFFMYEFGSGGYPTLDSAFDEPVRQSMGKFFPFGYMRYNKISVHEDLHGDDYKTNKRLFKYLNMDLETISKAVADNPDIKNVEQAIMMMGVPANATDQISLRYLFDFFSKLYYFLPVTYNTALSTEVNKPAELPPTTAMAMVIKDKRFKLSLSTFGIRKKRRAGRIGKRGEYYSSKKLSDIDSESMLAIVSVFTDQLVYYHQVTDATYDEISIQGLNLQYHIWNDYHVSASIGDDKLLIPLDYSITKAYPITFREDLYAKSLHFVFNAVVQTEVQWYQTGAFQLVMVIVAIAITVSSYGSDGGSAIATALGLSGTAGLIATIVVTVLIGMMMPSVYKLFVRTLGKEAANILALVAVVYGGYKMVQSGSVAGAPFASDLIQFGLNLHSAIIKQEMLELLTETEDFQRLAKEQAELLKKTQDLLNQQTLLSPMIIFGEKPEDFYNRTVHSGNIGVVGIDAISAYVASALTLPKLSDSLGASDA